MKKYTNIIILAIIVVAAAAFFIAKNINIDEILLKVGYYDEKISIVNTADVHGHIIYDNDVGGFYSLDDVSIIMGLPLIKHFADEERADNKNTLMLDCGDLFHGTNEANVGKGQGVVDVVNMMGYNGMVPGNHDFNFGYDRLKEIESQLNFPMLSANIYKDGKLAFKEYEIKEIAGKKIGLFGLTKEVSVSYTNSKDHDGLTIEEPIEAAKRVMEKLRGKVDTVILLSHLGEDIDEKIAREVDGIDLILSGHFHLLYKSARKVAATYLVEAGAWTTHIGIGRMYYKNGKVAKVDWIVKSSRDKSLIDKQVDAVAQKYYAIALESSKEIIGKSSVRLNGMRSQVRSRETNLGNLVADAMRDVGKASIALMNGGGIRESIPEGEINLYKVGKVLPFSNSIVTVEMKGEKIYSALERGIRGYYAGIYGGFMQVSGISYVFDGSKPAGERLVSVTMDGKPLDKNKIYTVALNDYIYNGGDDYTEFKDAKMVSAGGLIKDAVADYIKRKGEISPVEEGRIKVINEK